jgi:signal transduction histidine kinase
MANAADFMLLLLRQFAGGPGPIENNLVRFSLPAILWGVLLLVAWSRQRTRKLPREKLLLWGFGLGLARELFMFVQVAERVLGGYNHVEAALHQPIEHALAMAAIVVVAAAFLRYILDDERLPRRYLQAGLGATAVGFVLTAWAWPRQLAADPEILFHQTWGAWLFHLPLSILILVAILLLGRKRGWLRNVVVVALVFFFLGEVLMLTNYATDRAYAYIVCPIGNIFHILAIPLLGYVYLREQSIEKRRAEKALEAYRDHLEELVLERTEALTTAHNRLAAQEERQRIAANMHDGLGQTLGLLGLRVDQVTELVATRSVQESTQELHRIRELIEQASQDVRRSIASLQQTPRPRRSLQDQLFELLDQLPSDQGPPVHPTMKAGGPLFLPPEHEEQILPIVQEALLNAHYHAHAQQVNLMLEQQADRIRITVQDDGQGFDLSAVQRDGDGHFGLSIMRARAARIGAELRVDSEPGRGTRVSLSWREDGTHIREEQKPFGSPAAVTPALVPEAEQ